MIIRIEDIQEVCTDIISAVDSNQLSVLTETLELKVENQILYLSVTNREYYAQVKLNLHEDIDFHATVNAQTFLKLISQITTDTVEFTIDNTSLVVKGNGVYRLPLIYDEDKLLELPKIEIENPSLSLPIDKDILLSILKYNSKEIKEIAVAKAVQKLYYVDEQGCITFTSGACVNNFTLPSKVKFLLNNRLVKLFKLFKDSPVTFVLGHDPLDENTIQTKVKFTSSNIEITAILPGDDSLINSVPVVPIRQKALAQYPYSVSINKDAFIQAINRLTIFSQNQIKSYALFEFNADSVTIHGIQNEANIETIYYHNKTTMDEVYKAYLDFTDLKSVLDSCVEAYININFGDHTAIVINRANIYNVIAECHE